MNKHTVMYNQHQWTLVTSHLLRHKVNQNDCSRNKLQFPLELNEQRQVNKPAVHSIDAVRGVMISLLNDHQQRQVTTVATTTPRGSRLNNTTGVNITDDEFLQMIQEKEANKVQKASTKKRKRSNKTSKHSKNKRKPSVIGIDSDKENENSMEYEFDVRYQLDQAIEQAQLIINVDDSMIL